MSSPGIAQPGGGPEAVRRRDGDEPTSGDNTINIAIQIIDAVLAKVELSVREKDAWKRVRIAVDKPAKTDAYFTREAIEGIRREVAQIKTTLNQQQKEKQETGIKPMTYAEAAKAWRGAGEGQGGVGQKEMAVPARRQREVVVKPGKETTEQKNRNGKELVEQIQGKGGKEVVAARRLASGDVVVTTTHMEARKGLQSETDWLKAFGEGAKVRSTSIQSLPTEYVWSR